MHFSLLIFACLLLSFTSADINPIEPQIPESLYAGFKHLNGRQFAMELENGSAKYSPYMTNIILCTFSYCHGKDRNECADLCAATGHKFNDIIIGKKIMQLDERKQPDESQADCENRCASFCGKNDCKKECSEFCRIHWSYENRNEYEAEIYDFLIRLKKVKGVN